MGFNWLNGIGVVDWQSATCYSILDIILDIGTGNGKYTEPKDIAVCFWNPADSALSAAASSVGSTARSIVHFAR